jgi:hypothetical protein
MKKANVKCVVCGFMAGVLTMYTMPVIAKSTSEKIDVTYRNIKIYADGNLVNTSNSNEAFIYNGTTYLPVRAVGDAFNKAVDWDAQNSAVYLGSRPTVTGQPTVLLEDLDYFTKTANVHELSSGGKDNVGTIHSSGMGLHDGNIQYLLNGKYSIFKGTIGVSYDDRDTSCSGRIKIYGDGKLLYTSDILTAGTKPQPFNINVSGVLNLEIESELIKSGSWSYFTPQIYDAGFYS